MLPYEINADAETNEDDEHKNMKMIQMIRTLTIQKNGNEENDAKYKSSRIIRDDVYV